MAQIPATRGNPQASEIAVQTALPMVGALSREDLQTTLDLANNEIAKLFEDRNIELVDGGIITVNSTATTVAFSSSLKLHVNSLVAGGSPVIIDLASTTRTVSADGRMIYAVINRSAGTAVVTDDSATLPAVTSANQEVFLIAKRVGTTIYFRNGFTISAGNSSALKGQSSEYLQASISTDSSSTGANATITAVSGGIVRLTNGSLTSLSGIPATTFPKLLVLENKTGTTIAVNNEEATATAADRIQTGTAANVSLATDSSLFLVYDTTSARWQVVGGTGSGTGSGVINLIVNGNAESASSSIFTPYADAAGTRPVDGTGGSPTVTTSVTTTNPLTGTKSYLLTKPASNVQGQGWAVATIPLDLSYRTKVLKISVDYIVNSGTFVAGSNSTDSDIIWTVYDITNSKIVEPSSIKMLSNSSTISDQFQATVQFDYNCASFRLIAHCASTSAVAYEIKVDNITVSPSVYVYGTPITDWQQYTPAFVGLGTVTSIDMRWRRVGQNVEIEGRFTNGTTTGVAATVPLPSGLVGLATNGFVCGNYGAQGTQTGSEVVYAPLANNLYFGMANWGVPATGTQLGTGGFTSLNAKLPIQGWSSSVQMSDSADTRVVAMKVFKTSNQSLTSGAETAVTSWGVADDTHGAFNSTTGVYTAPVEGWYRITGQVAFASNGAGQRFTRLVKNGTSLDYGTLTGVTYVGGDTSTPFSFLTRCSAGTTLSINAFQNSGGALPIDGTANTATHMSIERVTGPSAIAANEKMVLHQENTAGTSIANSGDIVVPFATELYDSHGSFVTDTFTAQTADTYKISAHILYASSVYAAGNRITLLVYKNGSFVKYLNYQNIFAAVTAIMGVSGSTSLNLNAGDTIQIRTGNNRSAGATSLDTAAGANWVTIERIK